MKISFLTITSWLSKNIKSIIIGLLTILVLFLSFQNIHLKNKYNSNVVVLSDSLSTYKNKINELYKVQNTYIASEKELKKINSELSAEIKKLKEEPLVVTIIQTEYKLDTIYIKNSPIESIGDNYQYSWKYENSWFNINGNSFFDMNDKKGNTTINNLLVKSNLTLDIIENSDKKLQILVKTDNPYCDITSIQGAIVSPEKIKSISSRVKNNKRFGLGFQLGAGVALYGQNVTVSPYIGFGLNYNIITF